jgi:hypothetical protein
MIQGVTIKSNPHFLMSQNIAGIITSLPFVFTPKMFRIVFGTTLPRVQIQKPSVTLELRDYDDSEPFRCIISEHKKGYGIDTIDIVNGINHLHEQNDEMRGYDYDFEYIPAQNLIVVNVLST